MSLPQYIELTDKIRTFLNALEDTENCACILSKDDVQDLIRALTLAGCDPGSDPDLLKRWGALTESMKELLIEGF